MNDTRKEKEITKEMQREEKKNTYLRTKPNKILASANYSLEKTDESTFTTLINSLHGDLGLP